MRAFIVALAVIVTFLFIATQLFVPPLLEARVGEGLEAIVNGAPVQVSLSTFPAYRMLTGTVGRLDVNVQDFVVDGLRVADFELRARNLAVDVARMLRGETLPVKQSDELSMRAVVTEQALSDFVNDRLSFPGQVATSLSPEGASLTGDVELLGNVVPVVVTGRFRPVGSSEIVFAVDDVQVQGSPLPGFVLAVLKEAYTVRIDLSGGPLPLFVDDVEHESGRAVLLGSGQVR